MKYIAIILFIVVSFSCKKPDVEPQSIEIKSFLPVTATTDDPVRIVGTNFSNGMQVSFGGTAAKSVQVVSDSVIFAVVGAGASGNLSITKDGKTYTKSGFQFYIPKVYQLIGAYESQFSITQIRGGIPVDTIFRSFGVDTGMVIIMKNNPYDSARNGFEILPGDIKYYSSYASDTSLYRIKGIVDGGIDNVKLDMLSGRVLHLSFKDTSFTCVNPRAYKRTLQSLNGSLFNGTLRIQYTAQQVNTKKLATLVGN